MVRLNFGRFKRTLFLLFLCLILPISAAAQEEYDLFPREAEPGAAELQLTLTGPGLGSFGELTDVRLIDFSLESFYEVLDDETFRVFIWIPEDFQPGEYTIDFVFQETTISSPFRILGFTEDPPPDEPPRDEPAPTLFIEEMFPQEGEPDSDVEIFLVGESLERLGPPVRVEIGGVEVEIRDFNADDINTLRMVIYIPGDVSLGDNEISFIFEQAAFDEYFFVFETAEPPTPFDSNEDPDEFPLFGVIIVVVVGGGLVALVGGGMLVRRMRRKPKPKEESRPAGPKKLEFRHQKDQGVQEIFPKNSPISPDIEFRIDTNLEHIDTSVDQPSSIIDGDDENVGGMI